MCKGFLFCFILTLPVLLFSEEKNVVMNASFEMALTDSTRPRYWQIGFADSPEEYLQNGSWKLDTTYKTEGISSIKLQPSSNEGYMISQILHVPGHDLAGKSIRVSADVRHDGLTDAPTIVALAVNEALPPDVNWGVGLAGLVFIPATGVEGSFQTYESQFTANDNASFILLSLAVNGMSGAAWFDNIMVELEVEEPGPPPGSVESPITNRAFKMGFVQEDPINPSERAMEELIMTNANTGEIINLFSHIRWSDFTGESAEWGHRHLIHQANLARESGLSIALTFDFTHGEPDSVGQLNKTPDGQPVGSLNDQDVSEAFQQELLQLCNLVKPDYVFIGVEMNFFYENHPEQWDAYVVLFKESAEKLISLYPAIHVSSYFTLDWMVGLDLSINSLHEAVWRQLLPELQSIAFSVYPETFELIGTELPDGYFMKATEIAPQLPLIIPEFGMPGGPDTPLNFEQQENYLGRIFGELARTNVEAVCWYSMYDQSFFGAPNWFANAFGKIGMFAIDGTPKNVWALWQAVHKSMVTGVSNRSQTKPISDFTLFQNYPNPFNPSTTITYSLYKAGRVKLQIYDGLGREVKTLVNAYQTPNQYQISFDVSARASGLYYYRLTINNTLVAVKKLMLLK